MGGGVVVGGLDAQLELGELGGEVIEGAPRLSGGAGLVEVVGGAVA
jgi:hypothetical protein